MHCKPWQKWSSWTSKDHLDKEGQTFIWERVDMEEMAWKLKIDRVLREAILSFFFNLTREKLTWEQICEKYRIWENAYTQTISYSQTFFKDNRAKKTPSQLPISAITLLNHLFRATMGIIPKDESIPWKIKVSRFDMAKIKEFCNAQHVPFHLVVLDVHGHIKHLFTYFFLKLGHPSKHIECTIWICDSV